MMQDDFDKLMKKFEVSDPEQVNMEEIMGEVLHFFTNLKSEILNASPEEREAIFSNLSGMYTKLMAMTSQLATKMGMSEQELLRLSEDMKHFTPEQRTLIEKTKSRMMSEVEDLGKSIQEQGASGPSEEGAKLAKKEKKPAHGHHKGTSRSKWTRT